MPKLVSTSQVDVESLGPGYFDAFVAASGFETRATHCAARLAPSAACRRIALGFSDRRNNQRTLNDEAFNRLGFEIRPADGDSDIVPRSVIRELLEAHSPDIFRLLVDYSSMTRGWYGGILKALHEAGVQKQLECYFVYSPSAYSEPRPPSANLFAGPLSGFSSLDTPDRPSALVLGLGYETEKALGLLEYVDPATCFALFTDPALDEQFVDAVRRNNRELLRILPERQVIRHPMADLNYTANALLSLCSGLRDDFRVILAPLGVKPFSLACMLLSLRFSDVEVWRISSGQRGSMVDRVPLGPLLAMRVDFAPI